ncbi:MFS transporter, partial [Francisella tularensis subsp. holarctica]|nr:MFS transporter [Francisella tularensis subsp. holarctica]
ETMANGGWRILLDMAIIRVVLSCFIKHSGEQKKSQKSDISLTKIINKNYKSLVYMILLCFPGAVVAYFQLMILPKIIKHILKQVDVNVAILTTISIIMFI